MDLALNNLQRLICHKAQTTNQQTWFGSLLWHINRCRVFNAESFSTYILNIYDLVWFGLVLWHINHFKLFNARSTLYIYWMVFHWSLIDSKSPQVSRTLLSILAVLSNAVIWILSTRPPTSKSSRPFNNPLVIVPKAPITIDTIVTFMFHSFFNSLARSRYSSLFSHSFSFILWSAEIAKSTILQILFICTDRVKWLQVFST